MVRLAFGSLGLHCVCWGWFGEPALSVTVRLSGFRVVLKKFKQLLDEKSASRSSLKCSRAVRDAGRGLCFAARAGDGSVGTLWELQSV